MKIRRWSVLLTLVVVGIVATGCSDDDSDSSSTTTNRSAEALGIDEQAITSTVEGVLEETTTPGAVVLVREGDEEYLQAFGTRSVDGTEAVTVDDHFRVGSNTKTMTGTVLLQLVDEGLIALDDPVSMYRPDVPNGDNITIAQLLDMRSGLHNYSELEELNRTLDEEPAKVWDPEELLALAFAEEPYFEPEEGFHYSNTNTVLAGLIIEQLTGNPVEVEFATRIFEPLGLSNTVMPAQEDASIPEPHPQGYLYGTNVSTFESLELPEDEQEAALAGDLAPNDVTDTNPSWGWTAGAGISTARDLATYVEALIGGGLLSDELQQERLDSVQPTDPDNPDAAGYGLALARLGPMLGHDGSLPGYQSVMLYDADRDLTLIVLTNLQAGPAGDETANTIAQALVPVLYAGPDAEIEEGDGTEPL